jgi:hypothetical protein
VNTCARQQFSIVQLVKRQATSSKSQKLTTVPRSFPIHGLRIRQNSKAENAFYSVRRSSSDSQGFPDRGGL